MSMGFAFSKDAEQKVIRTHGLTNNKEEVTNDWQFASMKGEMARRLVHEINPRNI